MRCRLCLQPLNIDGETGVDLSVEDFFITKKSSKKVSLTSCSICGLVQADSSIPPEKLIECYQNVRDSDVEKELSGRKSAFHRDIMKCLPLISKISSVLEIGAFTGIASLAIKEIFPDVSYLGIEPNSWACEIARNRGQNIIQGKIGDPIERTFDIIFAWDVIEHLENPHEFFTWCNELSVPGAYLFINTPNWESVLRKVFGRHWWFIEPMHRTYFTPNTLEFIANKYKWEVIKSWRHTKIVSLPYLAYRTMMEYFNLKVDFLKRLPPLKISIYIGQMSILLKRT
jgi:2-polyprenyl-3-methyl-5-hydroxy-6-metoxy-1,4-benzoquinol methylase